MRFFADNFVRSLG